MHDREALIAEIVADARATGRETGRPVLSPRVLDALRVVPRHDFVDARQAAAAWRNTALPIGLRQTISQPFVVALMTDLLDLRPADRVLEVGTGSGYQAAVLARLASQVFSVEVIPELAARARVVLAAQGADNVVLRVGDGAAGWAEHAPFDAVIVTAATAAVPDALVAQMKPGARMAIPLGETGEDQMLTLIVKQADGGVTQHGLLPVRFVPLTGGR